MYPYHKGIWNESYVISNALQSWNEPGSAHWALEC